jgi:hypothetical protein
MCHVNDDASYPNNYDYYIKDFFTEYDRTNPITKDHAIDEFEIWRKNN